MWAPSAGFSHNLHFARVGSVGLDGETVFALRAPRGLKTCAMFLPPRGLRVPRTHLSEIFSEPTNRLRLRRPARVPRKATSTPGSVAL